MNPTHFFIAHDVAPGNVAQYSERFIHSEIYKARPDVMAVLHAHTSELRVFGQSSVKLRPVWNRRCLSAMAFRFSILSGLTATQPAL
jgi:ribulose-5-phosphate 4-epimerase/fuculose-1-phosphate aldolase